MHAEEDEVPVASKKKLDKGHASDAGSSPDKAEPKKAGKSDGEDPKPRIVLTFRSDKKNSNMKIVPNDEKTEEFSPRRSGRTRNKWEWTEEAEVSRRLYPKKDKNSSQPASEIDETDGSLAAPKRSTRRRGKDSSENVLANAIARKERFYYYEEGVCTRRTAQSLQAQVESQPEAASSKKESEEQNEEEEAVVTTPEKKPSQNTVMKLKHLCELGLKAINPEALEDEPEEDIEDEEVDVEEDENEDDYEGEENDEIDDDSEVISKLLEADEDTSDEDFNCSVGSSKSRRPRRSTRLCSSYGAQDCVSPMPIDEDQKDAPRRSSRRATTYFENESREYCPPKKKGRLLRNEEPQPEPEELEDGNNRENPPRRVKGRGAALWHPRWRDHREEKASPAPEEDSGEPAGGEEGSEAACPEDEAAVGAACSCEEPSNVHAAAAELTEPVFCQAIELVEGVRVGCSHAAARGTGAGGGALGPLLRAGPRAPFLLLCALHAAQLRRHMCCPACGLFCTQGVFYQCSEGHLFHLECGLPYNEQKPKPGCPHCGVFSSGWQPVNRRCGRVRIDMACSNKRIFLPDQREQCTPAYLSFSTSEPAEVDHSPLIPEDLLPSPPVDLKQLCQKLEDYDEVLAAPPAQRLADAILAGESVEELLPKIVSRAVVNAPLPSLEGGSSVHAAASRGHTAALYALHYAGADLDAPDHNQRSPLLRAMQALVDKPEKKSPVKSRKINEKEVKEESKEAEQQEDKEDKDSGGATKGAKETEMVKDEDLIRVIRYLVAAGCDVNFQDSEGATALHLAAQHGQLAASRALLEAAAVDVDAKDHGGWTPLVWAAENAHLDVARLLLSAGADAETRDADGNGALHWCALAGHAAVLRLLLAAAPHAPDAPNAYRDTPLHVAARQGHYACVVVLLARGARTDMENSAGELPVEVCSGPSQRAISLNMQMALLVNGSVKRRKLLSGDISNGAETYPIPCVNEVDDAPLPDDFTYVTEHVMPEMLAIDNTIQSLEGCSCTEGGCGAGPAGAGGCACCALSVRRWARGGRLLPAFPHHDPPMLFECNATCRCNKRKCSNMLITRLKALGSVFVRSCVFRTPRAGWGLRAAARVPRGAPVALYCGELLPLAAADTRANDQYLFALDVKPDLLEQCTDKSILCVDACRWGGAARFINHSCRANLAPVRVFGAARDLRLPAVALFATCDIQAGEELTFDYGDKFWSVKAKWMKCECGTAECRYPEKVTDEN